jgi:D-glycero-D-manno-heptose 1,7-bisphosphate phosphatase
VVTATMTAPIVFLDKDGTLVDNVPYSVDPARIRLAHGAADAVRRLHAADYRLVVVSNQSGVARGVFSESALGAVQARLAELLTAAGVVLAAFYYCPHHPEGSVRPYRLHCDCRKPAPGLLQRAARALGAELARCWMVGDILDDVEAGARAGCRTVLVDNGGETEWRPGPFRVPDHVVGDVGAAARHIVAAARRPPTARRPDA